MPLPTRSFLPPLTLAALLGLSAPLALGQTPAAASTASSTAPDKVAAKSAPARSGGGRHSASAGLNSLFDRHWEWGARNAPEWATLRGDHRYGDRLSDASPEALAQRDAQTRAFLAEAERMGRMGGVGRNGRSRLSASEQMSLDMFIDHLQRQVEEQAFPGWRQMSLRALGGPHSQFGNLLGVSPMGSAARVEQSLKRMAAFAQRMAQDITQLRGSAAAGWVPAREVLLRVQAQLDAQLAAADSDASPYVSPFLRIGSAVPVEQRAALLARAREATRNQVLPAIYALRALVVDELLPKAPAQGALTGYPEGARVYEMLVRQQTTTTLSAAQIHAVGQRELTRIRADMEAVQKEVAFAGSFADFVRHLNTDPKYFHTSAEELLASYRDIAKRVDAELPKLFAELPRAPYGIVGMPAFMGNRAEYYNGPALDGSRAGFFFANVVALKSRPKWAMETLLAHEAVPGHHLQIARANELRDLPDFRRSGFGYTAYIEGWALYAETLGTELGLYTDPLQRYGHLQWQAFRAARLVVDTGIHSMGWTREQAIEFMIERTGVDRDFVSSEVDRYTSNPGQALAYMIGKLKFDELRARAQSRLGPKFDIRRFHNAVLDQGAVPLSLLDRLVDAWIAAELKRKPVPV